MYYMLGSQVPPCLQSWSWCSWFIIQCGG